MGIFVVQYIFKEDMMEKEKHVSFGDRIRNMSDEQLAVLLTGKKEGNEYEKKLEELKKKVDENHLPFFCNYSFP